MKKKLAIILSILMTLIVFASCGKGKSISPSYDMNKGSSKAITENERVDYDTEGKKDDKIIITGETAIYVDDFNKASTEFKSKVNQLNGYIESESVYDYECNMVLRIPSTGFQGFIDFIKTNYEIISLNTSNKNITDEYIDNESRLKNLYAQEIQFLEVLKKANSVEDILRVQNELYRVRGEIEVLEGRKKYYDKEVAYSTLSLRMSKKQIVPENKLKIISGSDFTKSIKIGFKNSITVLILAVQRFIIFVLSNIISLLILVLILYFVWRKFGDKIRNTLR